MLVSGIVQGVQRNEHDAGRPARRTETADYARLLIRYKPVTQNALTSTARRGTSPEGIATFTKSYSSMGASILLTNKAFKPLWKPDTQTRIMLPNANMKHV